jgi:hypothetical protein
MILLNSDSSRADGSGTRAEGFLKPFSLTIYVVNEENTRKLVTKEGLSATIQV